MALVLSKNTQPELRVRKAIHAAGLRFRLHDRSLPGTPDLVFPSRRIALFVHGCFWHRHKGCANTRIPKTRLDFWIPKFKENVKRDRRHITALTKDGWLVLIIWECETHDEKQISGLIRQISKTRKQDTKN